MRVSEICVASDRSRVANISAEHLKRFKSNFHHGPNFHLRAGQRPLRRFFCQASRQRCIRAIPSSYPTILTQVMTPISPAQCPKRLQGDYAGDYASGWDELVPSTPEKEFEDDDGQSDSSDFHTPARCGSSPSACVFLQSVQLKTGKLMFLILILMMLITILYFIPLQQASTVSSARRCLGRLSMNGHLMNTIGRLPTKK